MQYAYIIFQSILKFINPLNLINKLTIFTFPIWITYNLFPSYYLNIKNTLFLNLKSLNEIIPIIQYTFNALVCINYFLLFIIIMLLLASLIQHIINFAFSLLGLYPSSLSFLRSELIRSIFKLFILFSIYIVSISLYSDLFFNYNFLLITIKATNSFWVSLFPFIISTIAIILELIYPGNLMDVSL